VLRAAGVVSVRRLRVRGPLGQPVDAAIGHGFDGTVYLEAAQACGLHLLGRTPDPWSARAASTAGVGTMLAAALGSGAARIVVGLGGSATTDGGMGAVDELGGIDVARARLRGVDLVVASDVDSPLLGAAGAAAVFGPQKGADPATVAFLEERLTGWAAALGDTVADMAGAGAAGGLGAALLALGGHRMPGADVVADATGRAGQIADADVIVTGEGRYDEQTARGKVIAALAAEADGTPVIVLAGQVGGTPDIAGVTAVRSMTAHAGSVEGAMQRPRETLAALAADVARTVDTIEGVMRE
jgi:glycerate kinase